MRLPRSRTPTYPKRLALFALAFASVGTYYLATGDGRSGAFFVAIAGFWLAAVALVIAEEHGHRVTAIWRVLLVVFFGGLMTLVAGQLAWSVSSGHITHAIVGFALLGFWLAWAALLLLRRRTRRRAKAEDG